MIGTTLCKKVILLIQKNNMSSLADELIRVLRNSDPISSKRRKYLSDQIIVFGIKAVWWDPPQSLPYNRFTVLSNDTIGIGPTFDDFVKSLPRDKIITITGVFGAAPTLESMQIINSRLIKNEKVNTPIIDQTMLNFESDGEIISVYPDGSNIKPDSNIDKLFELKTFNIHLNRISDGLFPEPGTNSIYLAKNITDGNNILDILMVTPLNLLIEVVRLLGFIGFTGDKNEAITLCWWMTIIGGDLILSPHQLLYINNASLPTLLNLLPNNEKFSRVSAIWSLATGLLPPNSDANNEYIHMDGTSVMRMAVYLYDFYSDANIVYSPYDLLASKSDHKMDKYITELNIDSVYELTNSLGMIIPPGNNLLKYYLDNIKYYKNVEPSCKLPDLDNLYPGDAIKEMEKYRDDSLIDCYDVFVKQWKDRPDLLNKILEQKTFKSPRWNYKNCDEMDKHVLSYGNSSYSCYEIDELMFSFKDGTTGFIFGIPKSKPTTSNNSYSLTNLPKAEEFPLSSIKQLLNLLTNEPIYDKKITEPFIRKIKKGLDKRAYLEEGFTSYFIKLKLKDQELIHEYIIHLFLFGMHMRLWDGKNDYPPMAGPESCTVVTKDGIVYEYTEMLRILHLLSGKGKIWLESIPVVKYDNTFTDPDYMEDYLHSVIVAVATGSYCTSIASTYIISTIIYIYQIGFGWTTEQFNDMLHQLFSQVPSFKPNKTEVNV